MDGQQLALREAYALLRAPAAAPQGKTNWQELVTRFHRHKTSHTGEIKETTWQSAYAPVMERLLAVMGTRPIPRDSRCLLAALRDRYGGAPGSRGRKLRIQYAAQFLRFCVTGMGVADRWLPPDDLVSRPGDLRAKSLEFLQD
jgi:hypothetical protein